MQRKNHIHTMVLIGLFSAIVFVLSMISIPIGEMSRLHLGNVACLLAGLLFGPVVGGLSAGFGSMLYDFTNPLYTPEFWITFIMKFAMGFIAGGLARKLSAGKMKTMGNVLAATAGAFSYVVLYVIKSLLMQHYVQGNPWEAVIPVVMVKAGASAINAGIAVAASVALAAVLIPALEKAGLRLSGEGRAH